MFIRTKLHIIKLTQIYFTAILYVLSDAPSYVHDSYIAIGTFFMSYSPNFHAVFPPFNRAIVMKSKGVLTPQRIAPTYADVREILSLRCCTLQTFGIRFA